MITDCWIGAHDRTVVWLVTSPISLVLRTRSQQDEEVQERLAEVPEVRRVPGIATEDEHTEAAIDLGVEVEIRSVKNYV